MQFWVGNILVTILLLALAACTPPRYALCKQTLTQGCRIVEIFDDQATCSFVAAGANGKDSSWNDLVCLEVPEQ